MQLPLWIVAGPYISAGLCISMGGRDSVSRKLQRAYHCRECKQFFVATDKIFLKKGKRMHFRYTGYGCIQHLLLSLQMPTSPCCRQLGFSNSLLTKVASALISIRISSTEDEKLGRFMFEK